MIAYIYNEQYKKLADLEKKYGAVEAVKEAINMIGITWSTKYIPSTEELEACKAYLDNLNKRLENA